jgi:hypothetical protein
MAGVMLLPLRGAMELGHHPVSEEEEEIELSESESEEESDVIEAAYSCFKGDEDRLLLALPSAETD